MSQTYFAGTSGAAAGRGGTFKGRLAGMGLIVVALLLMALGAFEGANSAGWTGTHGTLTVKECTSRSTASARHHNRRSYSCTGTFTADGSTTGDTNARVSTGSRGYPSGTTLSVERTALPTSAAGIDGDYVIKSASGAGLWFAAAFLGWLVLALGLLCTATGSLPAGRNQVRLGEMWRALGRSAIRPIAVVLGVIGLIGIVVSLLAGRLA